MKSSLLISGALAVAVASSASHGQEDVSSQAQSYEPHRVLNGAYARCKTPPLDPVSLALESALPPSDCTFGSTTINPIYDPGIVYEIPVVVHVIQRTDGTGFIDPATVQSQIDILNEDFSALPGSNGAAGVDTKIVFRLADVDPDGNPTTGITYSMNNQWFNDGGSYWNTLAWDTNRYCNIYTNSASGALGYVPNLPQGGIAGSNSDRVVVLWNSFGRNAPLAPFNLGRTATHELGHYFGLYHTFDNGCGTVAGCYTSGDRICDTNRQSSPTFGCNPGNSCSSPDPFDNYMDYSDDRCMARFTAEQANRMRCSLVNYRPNLASSCASVAAVNNRSAAANRDDFQATTPTLGGLLGMRVNLSASGHTMALVVGFESPANITLGAGQVLLVDPTNPAGEIFGLSSKPGPLAVYELPIPASLCGRTFYAQAIEFGGVFPFTLTNAQDLVFGF